MRLGWDREHIVAIEAAKRMEEIGVKAITVHGRTREDFYSGTADWEMIRKVKETVSIPVIGNGDVVDGKSAKKMLEQTGVDGIMIGRACLGRPWIFQEIRSYLDGTEFSMTKQEILQVILKHIQLAVEQKGEETGIKEMRKHLAHYVRNTKEASIIRQKINSIDTKKELIDCLDEYFKKI